MSLLIGNFFFWENNQYTMWPKAIWSHSSIPNIYSDYPPLRSTETFENFSWDHKGIRTQKQLQNEFDPIVNITIVTYLNVLLG